MNGKIKLQKDKIQSIVRSLDGENRDIYPHLAYLLQDLWEIGSSADVVLGLIRKRHLDQYSDFKVLDLGCGKGAVSIPMASVFGFRVHGIDAMPAFIEEACGKAEEYGVSHLCHFDLGDIRGRISNFRGYDLVLLGSIGPVLGTVLQTLKKIKSCVKPEGYVILDDGYISASSTIQSESYLSEAEMMRQIQEAGFICVDQQTMDSSFIRESNQKIYQAIEKRAIELMGQYPDKQDLFEEYLEAQARENQVLENMMICVTYLLKRRLSSHEGYEKQIY